MLGHAETQFTGRKGKPQEQFQSKKLKQLTLLYVCIPRYMAWENDFLWKPDFFTHIDLIFIGYDSSSLLMFSSFYILNISQSWYKCVLCVYAGRLTKLIVSWDIAEVCYFRQVQTRGEEEVLKCLFWWMSFIDGP